MATLRCPIDDCVFTTDKGGIPSLAGHIDCPGPGCTEKRGGVPPANGNTGITAAAAPAPAPAPAPPSDGFVLSDAEKAQILASRATK